MVHVTGTLNEREATRSLALLERDKLWPITYSRVAAMRFYQSGFSRLLPHDWQGCGPRESSRPGRVLARLNESFSAYSSVISLVDGSRMRRARAIDIRRRGDECQQFPTMKIIERTNSYLPNLRAVVSWDLATL